VWRHKENNYNGRKKLAEMLTKAQPKELIVIADYISKEDDIYNAGGALFINAIDQLMFIGNHLTMKNNLSIVRFEDVPMNNGDWTQKQFILAKLKGVEFEYGDLVQTYGITPELTEAQELDIVMGIIAADSLDSEVKVYTSELFNIELLVHVIEDKVYFVEELPEESVDTNDSDEAL